MNIDAWNSLEVGWHAINLIIPLLEKGVDASPYFSHPLLINDPMKMRVSSS
jgi:hypothetical protein